MVFWFFTSIFTYCMTTYFSNFGIPAEVIEIADYKFPVPESVDSNLYTVALFSTNDIHGTVFEKKIFNPLTNSTYSFGGLKYMSSYIDILRHNWNARFLWFDAGDQFTGGLESKVSNGTIIDDFFDKMDVQASAIGNHEFDDGIPALIEKMNATNFTRLNANIYKKGKNELADFPKSAPYKIYTVGKIKIGVIGLSTLTTPYTTATNITGDYDFRDPRTFLANIANELRTKQNCSAVILSAHMGVDCQNNIPQRNKLGLFNKANAQNCDIGNTENELNLLLSALPEGTIDAVLGGHIHKIIHFYIKGVPVVHSVNGGSYANIVYLTFNLTDQRVVESQIEGPLPICEKVFKNTKTCEYIPKNELTNAGKLVNYRFHGTEIKANTEMADIFSKWWEVVKDQKEKLTMSELLLQREQYHENYLGNLVTSCFKNFTKSDVSLSNTGGYRTNWYPGIITFEDLFNMFPFENKLVTTEMTGAEMVKMFRILQSGRKAFYDTDGLYNEVTNKTKTLKTIKYYNPKTGNREDIEDNRIYTVALSDFLLDGGDDFQGIRTWYTPKNLKTYVTLRAVIQDCLSKVNAITDELLINKSKPRLVVIAQ